MTSLRNSTERRGFIKEYDFKNLKLIVIGTSAGGISVLKNLFLSLPTEFKVPIVVVQHVGAGPPGSLAEFFADFCVLPVKEAEDKEVILPGHVYFAPPDYHLLISEEGRFHLSVDAPVLYSRPSIDVLFETAARACGARLLGVILTGANEDGARGLEKIRECGGKVAIQAPQEAEFSEMPAAALKRVPNPELLGGLRTISQGISHASMDEF